MNCLRTYIMSSTLIATVLLAGLAIVLTLPATPASVADAQNVTEFDIVLANGRVMDPESNLDAIRHVGIRNGK
nr:hypothetical protein [Pyrinomonadaceae bacterium]